MLVCLVALIAGVSIAVSALTPGKNEPTTVATAQKVEALQAQIAVLQQNQKTEIQDLQGQISALQTALRQRHAQATTEKKVEDLLQDQMVVLKQRLAATDQTTFDQSAQLKTLQKQLDAGTAARTSGEQLQARNLQIAQAKIADLEKAVSRTSDIYAKVYPILYALGWHGYESDGKQLPIEFNADHSFRAKLHAAQYLMRSGRVEAARSLFLGALAEKSSIEIYSCRGAPPPTKFSAYDIPIELLPLLHGSPYEAEVDHSRNLHDLPGGTVSIGVGKDYIPAC